VPTGACDSGTKIAPSDASCTGPGPKTSVAVRTSLWSMVDLGTTLKGVLAGARPTTVLIDKAELMHARLLGTALTANACNIVSHTNAFMVECSKRKVRHAERMLGSWGSDIAKWLNYMLNDPQGTAAQPLLNKEMTFVSQN
jgi:hypothetical protein